MAVQQVSDMTYTDVIQIHGQSRYRDSRDSRFKVDDMWITCGRTAGKWHDIY